MSWSKWHLGTNSEVLNGFFLSVELIFRIQRGESCSGALARTRAQKLREP
jgi:hypothetical protein